MISVDKSSEEPRKKRPRMEANLYSEDDEIEKINQFRVAEMRLKNNIFVHRASQENEKDKIPNPVMNSYQAFGLYKEFLKANEQNLCIAKPLQLQAWPIILRRNDTICIGVSGTGKTLAFVVPALLHIQECTRFDCEGPIVVCLSSTSESASEIKAEFHKFHHPNKECACIEDFNDRATIDRCKIIAGTPEQLDTDAVNFSSVSYVVLEKADEMTKSQVDKVLSRVSDLRQIIITSTKWCESVQELASSYCVNPVKVVVSSVNVPIILDDVTQQCEVIRKEEDKMKKAIELILRCTEHKNKLAVFCSNELTVKKIRTKLDHAKIPYYYLPVGTEVDRKKAVDDFKHCHYDIFLTAVAAGGLDVKCFTYILNCDFPNDTEEYIDRIRETRRSDCSIKVISLLSDNDWAMVPNLIAMLKKMEQVVPPQLYQLAHRFKAKTTKKFYDEQSDAKRMNQFRAAQFRLENPCIFVFRGNSDDNAPILNPIKSLIQAIGSNSRLGKMLLINQIFTPTKVQFQAWQLLMNGDDVVLVGAETTENRLAFMIPALIHIEKQPTPRYLRDGPTAICLCPSTELAMQIKNEFTKYDYNYIKCESEATSLNKNIEIVATIPERLSKLIKAGEMKLDSVSFVVIEEVEKMLLEKDNMNGIQEFLLQLREIRPDFQICITSATWSENVQHLASLCCVNPVTILLDSLPSSGKVTLQTEVIKNESKKTTRFIQYVDKNIKKKDKVIVLCNSESSIRKTALNLPQKKNVTFRCLLTSMNNTQIKEALADFKDKDVQILILLYDMLRDLSLPDITRVINFDFPKKIVDYVGCFNKIPSVTSGIKVYSLLTLDNSAIVPELIAILREMKQVVRPDLYDLANKFKKITFYEKAHFHEVAQTAYYVDKTMMIKTIIEAKDNYLITAPRKFGKTTNLDMLRKFFDAATAESYRDLFLKLKIGKCPEIMEKHYGQYAMLWVDSSKCSGSVDSEEKCKATVRSIIDATYKEYSALFKDLKPPDDYRTALEHLAELLYEHYKKKVILICDEFDWICDKAFSSEVDANTLDKIIRIYYEAFTDLVKTDNLLVVRPSKDGKPEEHQSLIYKVIFCGVTAITCSGASPLNTLDPDKFLESSDFAPYFGILKSEFEEQLENELYEKLLQEKAEAISFYNGYNVDNVEILSTYSVANYLSSVSEPSGVDRLIPYWKNSGSISRYTKVFERESMQSELRDIVRGLSFSVRTFKTIDARDLATINEIYRNDSEPSCMDLLYTYLQQLGYFSVVKNNVKGGVVSLQIPNEEIRKIFREILAKCVVLKLKIPERRVMKCATFFNLLIKINKQKAALQNIKDEMTKLCQSRPKINGELELNESTLEHIVYAVLLFSDYYPVSQKRVKKKILDLCFWRENFGIVVELKFNRKDGAKEALKQIQTQKYYIILEQLSVKITKKLFIGLNVSVEGEVDLLSTDDIERYTF